MVKIFFIASVVLVLSFVGCDGKEETDIDKLSDAYISILFAEDSLSFSPDSLKSVKNSIFKKHGLSEKDYLSQLQSFRNDKEKWKRFFDLVNAKLDSMSAVEDSLAVKKKNIKKNPKKFLSEEEKSGNAK